MKADITQLLFWAASDPDAQAIASAMDQLAAKEGRKTKLCAMEDLRLAVSSRNPDTTYCLIYTAPQQHLARRLNADDILDNVVAQWRAETEALLAFYRQNRARCFIFEAAHLQRFSRMALARLGLASEQGLKVATHRVSPDTALLRLVAQTCLQAQPELVDLTEELAASTLVLSNEADINTALPSSEALLALRTERERMAKQQNENIQLEAALSDLRHTLEEKDAQTAQVQAEHVTLQSQLARSQGAQDILQQQSTVLLAELRDATRQAAQTAQEVDRLTQDLAQQEAERAAQVQGFEAEIERIMASRSMRLTAPLRRLMALLGRRPDV